MHGSLRAQAAPDAEDPLPSVEALVAKGAWGSVLAVTKKLLGHGFNDFGVAGVSPAVLNCWYVWLTPCAAQI